MNKAQKEFGTFALLVIGSLLLLNLVGLRFFGRVDVTREHMFTLSQASRETVSALQDPVVITAYFTEDLPPPYSSNARLVRDLLEEYRSASKGMLSFEFTDPSKSESEADKKTKREVKRDIFGRQFRDQTEQEKALQEEGIQAVTVRAISEDKGQEQKAYMGMVLRYSGKKEVIPVIADTRGLEYNITTMIRRLTRAKTPVIGLIQGHDEPKWEENFRKLDAVLSQLYEVRQVTINGEKIDDGIDSLFVIGPKSAFKENELKAIDQFLMQGKSAAFFLDQTRVDLRSLQQEEIAHGLGPMLATYGISLGDKLVADVQSASVNMEERRGPMIIQMPVQYPFMVLTGALEKESPISEGLKSLTLPWVTPLIVAPADGTTATVLAKSSAKSWQENKPFNIDARRDWQHETITFNGPHTLAAEVHGKLKSHFAAQANSSTPAAAPLLAQASSDAKVIVVGSGAFAMDAFSQPPNQAFILNISDWMMSDPSILKMRNRGISEASLETDLSESTRMLAKYGNALGVPLALIAFGIIRWRMREQRRATVTA